jgi:hypothetical protein
VGLSRLAAARARSRDDPLVLMTMILPVCLSCFSLQYLKFRVEDESHSALAFHWT